VAALSLLCVILCVLCDSAVTIGVKKTHRRDAEHAELPQSSNLGNYQAARPALPVIDPMDTAQ
jgi:hypothetical protein